MIAAVLQRFAGRPNQLRSSDRTDLQVWCCVAALVLACVCRPSRASGEEGAAAKLKEQNAARVPLLSDEETWKRLPEVENASRGPLPLWARALAASLPRTTAAMLELDWMHRVNSPLEPGLRARIRYWVARANRCDYTVSTATFDLRQAGLKADVVEAWERDDSSLPETDRAVHDFARKMTLNASAVTDEEVARLVDWYGAKQVVAMVLLIAYANFQDRLILTLGLPVESSGPPPFQVRFVKGESTKVVAAPQRELPMDVPVDPMLANLNDASWSKVDYRTLQRKLDGQRDREPRIRVPTWDEVKGQLPEAATRGQPLRIKWSLVCVGYQPELANGWSASTRSFREDAKQDRVFEESLFWVITRSIDCFY